MKKNIIQATIGYLVGYIIFDVLYASAQTITLLSLGAFRENWFENVVNGFKDTFLIYTISYIILLTVVSLFLYKFNKKKSSK